MDLSYSAPDAQPSLFYRRVPLSGKIAGLLCDGCKRVFFYASGEAPEETEQTEDEVATPGDW